MCAHVSDTYAQIVEELAEMHPRDSKGEACHFCHARIAEKHEPDCLWRRARLAWIEKRVQESPDNPAGWMPFAEVPPEGFRVWRNGDWVHPDEHLAAVIQPHELVLARRAQP
jgi:hypothetical protein